MKIKNLALITALVISAAGIAKADPIAGSLGIAGGNDTWNTSTKTVDFTSAGFVVTADGTFASALIGTSVTLDDFSYATGSYSPFTVFSGSDGITLDLTSITEGYTNSSGLHIVGTGVLTESGYTPTAGTFIFNSSVSGDSAAFEATATATAVPEPASLALFGTGLLGIVGIARRKFSV